MTAKRTENPRQSPGPRTGRPIPGRLSARLSTRAALPPSRGTYLYAEPPTARFVAVKAVGSFVPTLTRKAFEKFGFSTATLITDWTQIVGAELASFTAPDRLKWPRGPSPDDEDETGGGRRPGTLFLTVDPARALDVEYRARQILDRINAYFGFRAVEAIRLIQAPLSATAGGNLHPATASKRPGAPGPGADPLTAALARLEGGVRGGRRTP